MGPRPPPRPRRHPVRSPVGGSGLAGVRLPALAVTDTAGRLLKQAVHAALDAWLATGDPDYAAAVRAAWETGTTSARPARSPAGTEPEAEGAEAGADTRRWAREDQVLEALGRIKERRGVALEERLRAWRHPWEHPGCAACDRGFADADDTGTRVVPCPNCRATRARGNPGAGYQPIP